MRDSIKSHLPTLGPLLGLPFRWITRKRLLRIGKWAAVATLILCFLVLLVHLFENVRGKKEWERVKAEVEAKGIHLEWADYIPEPVTDEVNFVGAPAVAHFQYKAGDPHHHPWQDQWGDQETFKQLVRFGSGGIRATASIIRDGEQVWHESRFEGQQRRRERAREEGSPIIPEGAAPWEQLEAQIAPHQQLLADLREAAQTRPEAFIHGDYVGSPFEAPMPSFALVRQLTQLLFADALIALRRGDADLALENAHCIHRLGNLNPRMYFLVNAMMDVMMANGFEMPIYQLALREGVLSESQLRDLAELGQQRHVLADLMGSFHLEIAAGAETFIHHFDTDFFFLSRIARPSMSERLSEAFWKTTFDVMPEGWRYIMASRHVYYISLIPEFYDAERRRLDLEVMEQNQKKIDEMIYEARFFDTFAAMAIPAFGKVAETALRLQCQQDMLVIACALELYRRSNDDLPRSLEKLQPDYVAALPSDPVTGEAYHYQRVDEARYRLWGVGMNGQDDDGVFDPAQREFDQADIIWSE